MPPAFAGPRAPDPNAPPPRILACSPIAAVPITTTLQHITVSATALPDAGLLRLCAMFHDAEARCEGSPDDGREWQAWLRRRWEVSGQIEGITPRTEAGRLAKARVALVLLEEAVDTSNDYERFVLATLRDLVGSAAA